MDGGAAGLAFSSGQAAITAAHLGARVALVERGLAEMPTAFRATLAGSRSGPPTVAMLAEYDALPGLSQDAVPERSPIAGKGAGHACGHHLFGTASTSAGIAIANWLKSSGTQGTIRVYGYRN